MPGAVEVIRRTYGTNWVEPGGREDSLRILAEIAAPNFLFHLSPEIGGHELKGPGEMIVFAEALEMDFSELRYEAEEVIDNGDVVIVLGHIIGQGRTSHFPFKAEFGHVWSLRNGQPLSVDAYLDQARARSAATAAVA